jgi:MSHA biogenesis protein MshJ
MQNYLLVFKDWYELRPRREQLLMLVLSLALLYAIFSLFLFRPLSIQAEELHNTINASNEQLLSWDTQLNALNKISSSSLYKKWVQSHQSSETLQSEFKFLLQSSPLTHWLDIMKAILHTQTNIMLLQVKNTPEQIYNLPGVINPSNKIYQQQFQITVTGNFYDTVNYLQRLEELLSYIHWDSLNYQVMQYPIAKVDMEFSILYEKNS